MDLLAEHGYDEDVADLAEDQRYGEVLLGWALYLARKRGIVMRSDFIDDLKYVTDEGEFDPSEFEDFKDNAFLHGGHAPQEDDDHSPAEVAPEATSG